MGGFRRALIELLVVTCVVIAAAAMVSGVLNALVSMADARVKAGPNVVSAHHRLRTPGGPLDGGIVSAPAAAGYSFRLLRSAYAGKAVQLRRASDSTVLDIGFVGGDFDTASAATFCNATSCFLAKWYDQSGNGRDLQQAAATQPALVFNCQGALPCVRSTALNQSLATAGSVTPAAGKLSFSIVANRRAGINRCYWITSANQNVFTAHDLAANTWRLGDGVTALDQTSATDAAWHAGIGVINGAGTVGRIDATETTGSIAGNSAAGQIFADSIFTAGTMTCDMAEAIWWDNYALTPTERANLVANQTQYWGF